ncbi:uncharacterized protein B0I36DRAFT_335945 [Microdochium trichocladiopsis]|uniref:poly(ADP-ribose) glycohydrolase n=1 Tax=Microdochium trichocladiopsis TaxID=1682393 RepID=A0A9P9BN33_9PEZI|nr:uncharacterized protein B0I36DRAFT_335945 [Microdochium trichocladiopsis]KAH7018422.1 hypothetical protein B0I36DRAFT_335945 [Microdochium trichocladiopsis]
MTASSLLYELPCSAEQRCLDRFSILPDAEELEDENGEVPVWYILQEILSTMPIADSKQLAEMLETIAITLRGSTGPAGDYGLLREVIDDRATAHYGDFFQTCWPKIKHLALDMPRLFEAGTLQVLGYSATGQQSPSQSVRTGDGQALDSSLMLSRCKVACILAHQFLCTLRAPLPRRGDYFDFSIWFSSQQRHPEAARIYLNTLFKYFSDLPDWRDQDSKRTEPNSSEHETVTYTLRTLDQAAQHDYNSLPLSPIRIQQVSEYDTSPEFLGITRGAAVVSANKVIGFGESATQEEIHVGCSPEACPAVLIVPELQHNQVLIIRGVEAVANIVGQRRGIRMSDSQGKQRKVDWSQRTMLFMDALELDMPEQYNDEKDEKGAGAQSHAQATLPDLVPQHMEREITKARLAFSSGVYSEIISPLWGCGAFNGDPFVKVIQLWVAASTSSTAPDSPRKETLGLRIVCDEGLRGIATEVTNVINVIKTHVKSVGQLRKLLDTIPKQIKRMETGVWLIENVASQSGGPS